MSRISSDLLRLLAIIGVLLIHGSNYGEFEWIAHHSASPEVIAALLVNQLARFCVPLFILLSGFGLYLKYAKRWNNPSDIITGCRGFFTDRAFRIGLPFVVLSIGVLAINGKFAVLATGISGLVPALSTLWTALSVKPAIYHFYFFTSIIQCYFFFPLIFLLPSRPKVGVALWFLFLATELLFCSPAPGWLYAAGFTLPRLPSSSPIYWLFWFYSGMMLARHSATIRSTVVKIPAAAVVLLSIATFGLLFWEYLFRASYLTNPGFYNHFSRWVILPFSFSVVALFIRFDEHIQSFFSSRPRTSAFAATLVGISFPVFIWHVWILQSLNSTFLAPHFFLLNSTLLILSFFSVWAVSRLLKKPAWLRAVLGLA